MNRTEALSRLLACLMLCTMLLGCGTPPQHPGLVKITGTVHVDGQSVEGVVLTLHPIVAEHGNAAGAVSTGVSGLKGSFEISTYSSGDGALPGRYNVTCVWSEFDPVSRSMQGDKLAGRYASSQSTALQWNIAQGDIQHVGIVDLVRQER